jgi:hypothetical protein
MFGNKEVERTIFFSRKWLIVGGKVAYKRIINCNNAVVLKNIGK